MIPHRDDLPEDLARRVWVRNLRPQAGGGDFAVKRTVGETVTVTADIFCDGHDRLAAVIRHRPVSASRWQETQLEAGPDDVWRGTFGVDSREPHEFGVVAWVDRFATWLDALGKKHAAGQTVASELLEGASLVKAAADRADGPDRKRLQEAASALAAEGAQEDRVRRAAGPDLAELMARWDDRPRATASGRLQRVDVSRERARFSSWYELFPRSTGAGAHEHGTFKTAEARLSEIAGMGFDIVYLPPIHPIGRVHRKGPNNTLEAGPGDPGSPWAIGAAEGGHTAVHPDLGTLEDFDAFVKAAEGHGLEVALDMAFQCSPDHPWVTEHPQWFRHRPDGTIKHAENPPKQYQDIYPLDFDTEDWRSLWQALLDVVLFWVDRGVRVFRVDNPHTKPLRFWGWLIAEVKAHQPDAVFLSEAFTRPKVMYALAQAGFDQSYTYFTWRNTRQGLTDYFEELTRTEVREFFRPCLWPNTPDILPEALQLGGRPAFVSRLVLAATLGASYGIYSGYELCENAALPGREEYLDSEKFQIRHREWARPDSLRPLITRLNRIRRENPALQSDHRLRFHPTDSEHLLFYSKTTEDLSSIVLVVVNLDPHHVHHGWVEVPLAELGLEDDASYQVHDLLGGGRYLWHGSRNYVRLDPAEAPAQIYRLRRRVRTERDFDYFL